LSTAIKKARLAAGFHFARTRYRLTVARTAGETIAAIDRLVATRLERNFRYSAALAAGGFEHFARGAISATAARRLARFTSRTTVGATVGFVLKALCGIKFLFAGGKRELTSAIYTIQLFICVH